MPEQFGFEQRLGEGGAVHRDEGLGAPWGEPVEGARHEFLSGPALAGEEDGAHHGGDHVHPLEDLAHGLGAPDDSRLALQIVAVEVRLQDDPHLVGIDGNRERLVEIEGPCHSPTRVRVGLLRESEHGRARNLRLEQAAHRGGARFVGRTGEDEGDLCRATQPSLEFAHGFHELDLVPVGLRGLPDGDGGLHCAPVDEDARHQPPGDVCAVSPRNRSTAWSTTGSRAARPSDTPPGLPGRLMRSVSPRTPASPRPSAA